MNKTPIAQMTDDELDTAIDDLYCSVRPWDSKEAEVDALLQEVRRREEQSDRPTHPMI